MDKAVSRNGVPIRLTNERWFHITEGHSEMSGYFYTVLECIKSPEVIFNGGGGELIAVRELEAGKYLAAIYKELDADDGFVITAFLTRRIGQLERREKVWEKQK